jgi:hypothetical protein
MSAQVEFPLFTRRILGGAGMTAVVLRFHFQIEELDGLGRFQRSFQPQAVEMWQKPLPNAVRRQLDPW